MQTFRAVIVLAATLLPAATAAAHGTLGEVLDAGGKVLDAEQFRATFLDARLSGPTRGGATLEGRYSPAGTFKGTVLTPQGHSIGLSGPWTVEPSGKVCVDITNDRSGAREMNCVWFLRAGEQYYLSTSDTDRATPVLQRSVKK